MKKILQFIKGQISARIAYPYAERKEQRAIREKLNELKMHYALPFVERKRIASKQLAKIVEFAGHHVPYYRDLFASIKFDPVKLQQDVNYLQDIPLLTKDILREQGDRLFSRPLRDAKYHLRKTGGSTGSSCFIYYDQPGLDYTAATVLYARQSVGKKQSMSEMHFACRFPESPSRRDKWMESLKSFAMNRTNVYFDSLDDAGLEAIWRQVKSARPYLLHAHPSTIYALACYVAKTYGKTKVFEIFESSGELMESYMRDKITKTFACQTIERYGLAEFGVVAYQTNPALQQLLVLDSEGWMETVESELIYTGFHNHLMPLIRFRTGDLGTVNETPNGFALTNLVGRIHDVITIRGTNYATHYVQDIVDRVGGIQEFQIDLRYDMPRLMLVAEPHANQLDIEQRLNNWLKNGMEIKFIAYNELVRVGSRAKFRHVVQS